MYIGKYTNFFAGFLFYEFCLQKIHIILRFTRAVVSGFTERETKGLVHSFNFIFASN